MLLRTRFARLGRCDVMMVVVPKGREYNSPLEIMMGGVLLECCMHEVVSTANHDRGDSCEGIISLSEIHVKDG